MQERAAQPALEARPAHESLAPLSFLQRWLRGYFQREMGRVFRMLAAGAPRIVQVGGDGGIAARIGGTLHITDRPSQLPSQQVVHCDLASLSGVGPLGPAAILIPDAVPSLGDVQGTLEAISARMTHEDRLMVAVYSSLWDLVYRVAEAVGLKARPERPTNWVNATDLRNFLRLTGYQVVREMPVLLCPFPVPPLDWLLNRVVVRLPLLKRLAMSVIVVARRRPLERSDTSVSIIIPARTERENLEPILRELPQLGTFTEILLVEGHSTDRTYERACELAETYSLRVLKQEGQGKADAVRRGFDAATGEILLIYDADRTVPIQSLLRFYEALASGEAEFANGTRLVYPMEDRSMRLFNKLGNHAFTWLLAYILDYPIRDTLCGTKALFRRDYLRLRKIFAEWSTFDPFGDFELLFGARQLNLAVIDLPVHYRSRRYGATNIRRWRDGLALARLAARALQRMVFF